MKALGVPVAAIATVLSIFTATAAGCQKSAAGENATATAAPASNPAAVPAANPAAATKYTCPMHPEVAAEKPGRCPKCGMDLVVAR